MVLDQIRIAVYRHGLKLGTYGGLMADITTAEAQGLGRYWIPSAPFSADGLTLATSAAARTESIRIGVGVVPVPARHPMVLAQQALTLSGLSNGRLSLGVGMGVSSLVEGVWGLAADRPRSRLEAFLEVLRPLLNGESVSVENDYYQVNGALNLEPAPAPQLVVAAMGPGMAATAGHLAEGAMTFLAGPKALREVIIPSASQAATDAGRAVPEIIAAVPVCVTDRVEEARYHARSLFAVYDNHPSGRRLLDVDDNGSAGDFAIVGGVEQVHDELSAFQEAGANEIAAICFGPTDETAAATRSMLAGA